MVNDNLYAVATSLYKQALCENANALTLRRIEDIADVKGGKRLPKGIALQSIPNEHPYIRVRDLNDRLFVHLTADFEYVDDETQKGISRYIVDTGDVIVSIVGTIGLTAIVHDSLSVANLTENCVKLTNLRDVSPEYLLVFLRTTDGQRFIRQGTVGAVQPKLPIKNIQSILLPVLPQDQRESLYSQLKVIFEEISRRISENSTLSIMRDTLLPRLMSGEIDVSDIQL